ncbi:putative 2-aminoethylphosphonate ABC transporter substrate-binding protein [Rhodoligotrophos defluvii]|uniref:putative 2-aminoethylphosphonate ABC transporter substrate-binding protein n=1 Tax=Rhodoligotrophos defluvii TaxID=2561934 RepID=UPI001EF00097|nr:putative 2-aminoethylphosphonate ABC transporter substrate-binding protein [Rhodoligotrophos defluvii]
MVPVLAVASAVSLLMSAAASGETLTVYTTLEKEQLAPYAAAFNKVHPDIQISWLRDSPGIVLARLLAEKDNPKADVVWGIPLMHLLTMDKLGMLQPYAPKGYEELKPRFRDDKTPPSWTGMDTWMTLICFNTVEAKKRGIPEPKSWSDLAKPVYKGQITMPSPASSHTGYLAINHWSQTMGDKAWDFMDALHENIALYTHSGSKPCKMAATGEYVVGISTDITAPQLKAKRAPIDIIVPSDGTGWDIEATAIMKGTKHLEAAKALADFSVSQAANEAYNQYMAIVARPGEFKTPDFYPKNAESAMADQNLHESAEAREAMTKEWVARYDSKVEPN